MTASQEIVSNNIVLLYPNGTLLDMTDHVRNHILMNESGTQLTIHDPNVSRQNVMMWRLAGCWRQTNELTKEEEVFRFYEKETCRENVTIRSMSSNNSSLSHIHMHDRFLHKEDHGILCNIKLKAKLFYGSILLCKQAAGGAYQFDIMADFAASFPTSLDQAYSDYLHMTSKAKTNHNIPTTTDHDSHNSFAFEDDSLTNNTSLLQSDDTMTSSDIEDDEKMQSSDEEEESFEDTPPFIETAGATSCASLCVLSEEEEDDSCGSSSFLDTEEENGPEEESFSSDD